MTTGGDYSFTIIDVNSDLSEDAVRRIRDIRGVISARVIKNIL